ncbi:hypothetical protein DPMN_088669 [Dreissena polymorpha]|uniref:Uncharacterized protein n=1 Tax=Dreissena polymorpha TaxID=45954 RepID=A0A9D4KUI5_DREPO|nr:hypothetical protein DPMN_088669 [Dreissena polymorpha]
MKCIVKVGLPLPKDGHKQHPLLMKNSINKEKPARGADQDYHYIYKSINNHQHHPQKLLPKEIRRRPSSFQRKMRSTWPIGLMRTQC